MTALTGWIVAYLARWLPHRAPTGLFPVGNADEDSPVVVTANFTLTVRRVRRALAGRDVWLLVAQAEGINVWCAATGGIFTENRIIDAIKVSRLAEVVAHRRVILPSLSAPGVDREAVKRETGFRCRFGPVYARDIPAFVDAGMRKSDAMRRFDFGWRHRLDMFLSMNVPIYLLAVAVLALLAPRHLPGFTALFWFAVAFLYLLLDVLPGRTGWGQAMWSALTAVLVWAGIDWYLHGDPLAHWGWLVATFVVFFAAGFDLVGTLSARTSDAERMMHRLGFTSFGSLFVEKEGGRVRLDRDRCGGCLTCWDLCPVGVFEGLDPDDKVAFADAGACFSCGACVNQCPEEALSLGDD
jgi:NAD-dependent dihydropyrimidine dehydrogenase PreA subunit